MTLSEAASIIALIGVAQTLIAAMKFVFDNFPDARTREYAADTILLQTGFILMLMGIVLWLVSHLQWV